MQKKTRLNKYIADCGLASRRGADELILEGKVKVNGKVVDTPGVEVGYKDKVHVDGKLLVPQDLKYVIFNKPAGYITSRKDPQERKTIYALLPEAMHNLKTAGRLDKASTGLLILTNDGDLIQKLTHPKAKVAKVYRVCAEGKISRNDIFAMSKGIEIEKGKIAYADCAVIEINSKESVLEMVLYQGYNKQIRRMLEILGYPVKSLKRIAHASLNISGLERGQYRYLKPKEVQALKNHLNKSEKANVRTEKVSGK